MSTKLITSQVEKIWNNDDLVRSAKMLAAMGRVVWEGASECSATAECTVVDALRLARAWKKYSATGGGVDTSLFGYVKYPSSSKIIIPAGTRVEFNEDGTLKPTGEQVLMVNGVPVRFNCGEDGCDTSTDKELVITGAVATYGTQPQPKAETGSAAVGLQKDTAIKPLKVECEDGDSCYYVTESGERVFRQVRGGDTDPLNPAQREAVTSGMKSQPKAETGSAAAGLQNDETAISLEGKNLDKNRDRVDGNAGIFIEYLNSSGDLQWKLTAVRSVLMGMNPEVRDSLRVSINTMMYRGDVTFENGEAVMKILDEIDGYNVNRPL